MTHSMTETRMGCLLMVLSLILATPPAARGEILVSGKDVDNVAIDDYLADDLLHGLVADTTGSDSFTVDAGSLPNLTDDNASQWATRVVATGTKIVLTYSLDVSTNTAGYDLAELRMFTSTTNARKFMGFDLLVRKVGESGFETLVSDAVFPGSVRGSSSENDFGNQLELILNDSASSTFASNVEQVRVVLNPVASSTGDGQIFRPIENAFLQPQLVNIDLTGQASVIPEPASLGLLGLGLILMRRH